MSKPTAVPDFNIVQNVDWDPMEILKTNEGKVDDNNFKAPADVEKEEEEEIDESAQNPDPKKPAPKKVRTGPDFSNVELADEDIDEALKKAKGGPGAAPIKKPAAAGNTNTPTDDSKDDKFDPNNAFAAHYQMMVDGGFWQELKDFDGTEESYIKARDMNQELLSDQGVDQYLEEAFEKNPEGRAMGKRLLTHLANGGKVSDFIQLASTQEIDFDAVEGDDDDAATAAAKDMLPKYYQSIGWKKPQIDAKMKSLEKIGGEVEEAKLIAPTFKEAITNRANLHAQNLKANKEKEREKVTTTNTSLMNMINKGHQFGELSIGKDKKSIQEYQNYLFTTPAGKEQPEFATALQEGLQDPEFLLYLAVALKHKLHKNPEAIANGEKSKQAAITSTEETLSNALLNKRIGKNQAQTAENNNQRQGAASEYQFDLENAVPIHVR